MEFFSMGMFCVDEIHTPETSYNNVIGGAGTYAAIGAAIGVPPGQRKGTGFICDEGYDFAPSMRAELDSWKMGIIFRHDNSRETTKAWNKFVDNEQRLFKYLSPKLQITAKDMPTVARDAHVVHLICSPVRCREFIQELRTNNEQQIFVWEPVPTECNPSQFPTLKQVIVKFNVDVLSPNALEAAACVGLPEPGSKKEVEELVAEYYEFAPVIVLRCGAMGSYLRTPAFSKWYPAYFGSDSQHRVVDPSGAGNAFTGGVGIALAMKPNTKSVYEWDLAMAQAAVGASFMIEQVGPPKYDPDTDKWNGESASYRLQAYLEYI